MSKSSIYDKFNSDKEATLTATQEFLQSNQESQGVTREDLQKHRENATKFASEGRFAEALQSLERLRDAKTGIVIHEVIKDNVPIVVRDARGALTPPARETEAFEMQYINAVRASIDIATIEGKPELKEALQKKALEFMDKLSNQHSGTPQKELAGLLKQETTKLGEFLEEQGTANAYKKRNVAKEFQNFNDKHSNIVTVSSIKHNGQTHTVVEAEVAMKSLTEGQKNSILL